MEEKPSVLVVGGGVAGIQACLDLGDRGFQVYLVENTPSIGGRMAQLDKTFPTMDCSICILAPKMIECYRHPNVEIYSYSEVKSVEGGVGNFKVKVLKKPRYIKDDVCTGCGICTEKCPVKVPNEWEMNLGLRKAIYLPFLQAVPRVMTIDTENCLYFTKPKTPKFPKGVCRLCERFCDAGAVDFDQEAEEIPLNVGSIILATGFNQIQPTELTEFGYKRYKDVVTALEFERLVCASGPLAGHLKRLSKDEEPKRIAFIQCVGSRDLKTGYPFCSAVCCMYATKEAVMVKEHYPDVEVSIFYIDLRAFGKGFQEFVDRAREEYGVKYIRSIPGEIREDPETNNLTLNYDDTLTGELKSLEVDMVVLCSALIPKPENRELAKVMGLELDQYGFYKVRHPLFAPVDATVPGIFVCGYSQSPKDIPDSVSQASGAAARAAEVIAIANKVKA